MENSVLHFAQCIYSSKMHNGSNHLIIGFDVKPKCQGDLIYGSIALLLHFTSSEVRFLDLDFLRGAGGLGNPCYGVQVHNCKFRTLKVQILKVLTLWYCVKVKQHYLR